MLTGPEAIAAAGARPLPIYLEGRLIPLQDAVSKELGLNPNQVVKAVVEIRPEGSMVLVNGRYVELPPQLRFRPGDEIWLRMVQTGKGPALQVSPPPADAAPTVRAQVAAQASALVPSLAGLSPSVASLFVRPADYSGLMALFSGGVLTSLVRASSGSDSSLSRLFPLIQFFNGRISSQRITPEAVKLALKNAGLYTEHRLAQGQTVQGDLKIALMAALRQLEAEQDADISLKEALEGSIRELQSSQADSLVSQSHRELLLTFLLPFRDAPPAVIRFFRPAVTPEEPDPPISFDIHTQSPELGNLWLSALLHQESDLSLTMWAERESVAILAGNAVSDLEGDLEEIGLHVQKITVLHGRRPDEVGLPPGDRPRTPGSVLDLKA
ncbi:MAG: hypothetical protein RLZZ290_513 [Pseudomonadota bacterium]|jgi:hypothetical protein